MMVNILSPRLVIFFLFYSIKLNHLYFVLFLLYFLFIYLLRTKTKQNRVTPLQYSNENAIKRILLEIFIWFFFLNSIFYFIHFGNYFCLISFDFTNKCTKRFVAYFYSLLIVLKDFEKISKTINLFL